MEKEMVSDRHNQYVPLPCFRHERFKVSLLAADVNLFMPTVIFCSAIRYFPRYSGPPIAAKIADSGAG